MIEITVYEAKKRLINACHGLYADFISYLNDDDIISSRSIAYEIHGAVIIKTLYAFETFTWYICDIGNSDMSLVLTELTEKFGNKIDRAMFHIGNYAGEHCLSFSCIGKPFDDSDIRALSEDDLEQITSVIIVPDDDSEYAKCIAQNISEDLTEMFYNTQKHIFGIFDGKTLAGIITFNNRNNMELIFISNVFIPRDYRRRGYATRLIRAATAVYPDVRYFYSCGTSNLASVASAKSAGYIFEGTYICSI